MKGFTNSFKAGLLPLASAAVALVFLGFASQCRADNIQTLTDNNSSVQIDLSAQKGMYNWTVDGIAPLVQQWFWYRIGPSGAQASIDTLTLGAVSNTGNALLTTYFGNGFNIGVAYQLTGGAAGSGGADLTENLSVNNTSSSNLDFHLFQYSHFNLSGGHDSVTLGKQNGLYHEALQTAPGMSLSEYVDTVNTTGANHGEAALSPQTLNELNGTPGYTLNDHTNAGPGDVTWALEWDKSITPGGSLVISKDKSLQVPEPTAAAVLALGLAVYAVRRRRSAI